MSYDYDLFVLGAGSGGVRASRMASGYGARVAVAEHGPLGGTCVNVGCVPKKLFVYGSHFAEEFEDASAYGWRAEKPVLHWPTLRDNKTKEIQRLNGIYARLLDGAGVEVIEGHARFVDPHTLQIGERVVTAEHILIATGGRPYVPEFPGSEHVLTSDDMFFLEELPKHAVVVGGGYIAVEFAGILNGLGVDTELVYRGPLFLRGFDEGVRNFVRDELLEKGIRLRFNTLGDRVEKTATGLAFHLVGGDRIDTDLILGATGRRANTGDLALENAGVALNPNGSVHVDEHFRTNVDHIYAIGDVIDRVQLTPVAIAEGMRLAANLFDGKRLHMDYDTIPTAVFCQPNIGTVGPTEEEAMERYPRLQVYESTFKPMKHTLTGRSERTLMKLLVNGEDDRVVGAHMVGPDAGEIIQGLAVAIKAGATKAIFDSTVGIHPTAAEEFVTMREPAR